jgi:hypothetical protein
MNAPEGKELPPTGTSFEGEVCTLARGDGTAQLNDEALFYDREGLMMQIGLK